ncbi:hypothetical protein DXG01_013155 [Tephrocybe rancida]|nr:hypothetical protein DXG01_013155 [Tephrocybe rancida]
MVEPSYPPVDQNNSGIAAPEDTVPLFEPPDNHQHGHEEVIVAFISRYTLLKGITRGRIASSVFALLIGIDKYQDPGIPDLSGAVNDANAVDTFLTTKVGASKDRIVNLRDDEATREGIMNALRSLAHNSDIGPRDPIFIYYAGHGSEVPTSGTRDEIKMFLPHDFKLQGPEDAQGQGVLGVELSLTFADLARSKSNNITMIVDCCHVGYGTRKSASDGTLAVRGVELPCNYFLPKDFFQSGPTPIKGGSDSHVVLTACKQGQVALETRGRGLFTSALLTLLEEGDVSRLTYTEIIARLTFPSQNPQCEGVHQNRILFSSSTAGGVQPITYDICPTAEPGEYTLGAGIAHGIGNGATLSIYSDEDTTTVLGSVVARDASLFTTRCSLVSGTPSFFPQSMCAAQTFRADEHSLCLFINPNDPSFHQFKLLIDDNQSDVALRSVFLVEADGKPDLALSTHGGLVRFEVMNETCRQHGLTHMPFDNVRIEESEYLASILRSASDFYWRLDLHSSNTGEALARKIDVECIKLTSTGELTDDLDEVFEPVPNGKTPHIDGTIYIDIEDEAQPYGYSVNNFTETALYVALFYFDFSDLSIVPYYLPKTGQADFSIPRKNTLSVGFGDSGWPPCTYFLREGQRVDVGFLRLYISTKYVDFHRILQESPFSREGHGLTRGTVSSKKKLEERWGALTIPIVQRRVASG